MTLGMIDLVLEQGKRGSLARMFLVLFVITALLLYVGGKVRIMRLGYQIEALEHEKGELERANRSLRIETASLASPARIEELAIKNFGMIRPPKDRVVIVKRAPEHASVAAPETGMDADAGVGL